MVKNKLPTTVEYLIGQGMKGRVFLVPTISTEIANGARKMPWAPIAVIILGTNGCMSSQFSVKCIGKKNAISRKCFLHTDLTTKNFFF